MKEVYVYQEKPSSPVLFQKQDDDTLFLGMPVMID